MRILTHDNPIARPVSRAAIMASVILTSPQLSDSFFLIGRFPGVLIASQAPVIAIVVFKCVWFLTVNSVVADFAHFVRHAEGDPADVFDEAHDERCPDDVPADDEKSANDLETDLAAVTGDGAARIGDAKGSAAFFGSPETYDRHVSNRSDL